MSLFYQQDINDTTRLGVWKIEEDEDFFMQLVPLHRKVTHPHKRLQHLAGRFLLRFLYPDFPSEQIQIADTRKPYLPDEAYHFSISHCGEYAAAILSKDHRVGIDIEIPTIKVQRVQHKFLSEEEQHSLHPQTSETFTELWSAKESVYKWYGLGEVDFKKHIQLKSYKSNNSLICYFAKTAALLDIHLVTLSPLCLSYIATPAI